MENLEIEIFYYLIKSELEKLKSDKLNLTRLQPTEIVVKKLGYFAKRKLEKAEKLRKKVEAGYISGIDKSIKMVDRLFERFIKMQNEK